MKKGFTLTELLVVVIVIGILSAVVLPKFSKVIETRKTTEAEELMSSIRTEQEKRCALDKTYLTQMSELTDVVKTASTKNYNITLKDKGIHAKSTGSYNYTLQMPSYADGRICCTGTDCEKLNKNYPKCEDLIAKADYQAAPDSCAGVPPPPPDPEPTPKQCSGSSVQTCGCQNKGTQTRTCNTTTGQWSDWGSCSVSDVCECTGTKPDASQRCNLCGTQTREVTCNTSTGEWSSGEWGACDKTRAECLPSSLDPIEIDSCFRITTNNWSTCCADKPLSDSSCYQTCQEKKTVHTGSNSGDAEQAADPYLCNELKKGEWREDSRCLGVNAESLASGICAGMVLCNGFAYVPVKNTSSPGSTLKPVDGNGSNETFFEMEYYTCAVGETCSKTCRGFHDGWVAGEFVSDESLKYQGSLNP